MADYGRAAFNKVIEFISKKKEIDIDDYKIITPEIDDTARFQRFLNDIGTKRKTAIVSKGTYTISGELSIADKSNFSLIFRDDAIVKRAPLYTGSMFKIERCSKFFVKSLYINTDDGFGTPAKIVGTFNADATTYTVDTTEGYKNSGWLYIYTEAGIQSVSYSGKTATSFTGCKNFGAIGGFGMDSPVRTGTDVRPIYGSPFRMIGVSDVRIQKPTILGNFNHAASDAISIEAIGTETTTPQGYKTFVADVPTENVYIYGGTFRNIGEEAIIWRNGCSYIKANNNYFNNVWGTAITNKGHSSEVAYNMFVNCYLGTEVNGEAEILGQGHKNTVKGNQFYDCGVPIFMQTTGVKLELAGKFVSTYIVQDNEMYRSKICGIYGRHGFNLVAENNKIDGVLDESFDFRTFSYGRGNGIYLFNVHESKINNNDITNCKNDEMWIDSCQNFSANENRTRSGGFLTRTTEAINSNASTFKVETTTGYADSGTFKIVVTVTVSVVVDGVTKNVEQNVEQTISYTGKTADSFTGCSGGDGTAVPVGSFVRDVATKRQVYINTCRDYEYKNNKTMNGYVTFHNARDADVLGNKVENTDSTAAFLISGNAQKNRFKDNTAYYARQYGMRFDGTDRIQDANIIKNNSMMYVSAGALGGNSAIQLINNTNPIVNDNSSFTDLANKPTYCVELMSSVTGGTALDNIATGTSGSTPNKDWNTTTPNNMRSKKNEGTITYSADGVLGSKSFPHGLKPSIPTSLYVLANSQDAGNAKIKYFTADATNIYVYFETVPAAGTNNISLKWGAGI